MSEMRRSLRQRPSVVHRVLDVREEVRQNKRRINKDNIDERYYDIEIKECDAVSKRVQVQMYYWCLSSLSNSISAVTNRMFRNSNLNLRPPRIKTKL